MSAPIARNRSLAARLHWRLLPAIGAYYWADAFGERVPLRWRVGLRLMRLIERLPNAALFEPLPAVVCDCDECRAGSGE